MKIQIIVAAHKAYRMPTDPMYLPLHVGKAGKDLELGFQGDNTGENISEKNATYCELTGLYWAWKNLNADYIGLAHYRRHFRGKSGKDKWDCILTTAQAEQLLIGTLYSQYAERRTKLSGEIELHPDALVTYTEQNQEGKKFILTGETQDCITDTTQATIIELRPDEYDRQ